MPVIAVVHCVQAAAAARRARSIRRPARLSRRHGSTASPVPGGADFRFVLVHAGPARSGAHGR